MFDVQASGGVAAIETRALRHCSGAEVIRQIEEFTSQWRTPDDVIAANTDLEGQLRCELSRLPRWHESLQARALSKKVAQHRFDLPFKCNLEVAAVCPLRCEYCVLTKDSAHSQQRRKPLLDWEDFLTAWHYMEAFTTEVEFTGGEPVINPHLGRMIQEMNRAGVYSQLTTNAQLLREDRIEQLLQARPVRVLIAYDSSDEEAYESTRLRGRLSKLNDNIHRMISRKRELGDPFPEICLQMVVHRKNYQDIDRFWAEAEEMGADSAAIKPVLVWPGGNEEYQRKMVRDYLIPDHPMSYHKVDGEGRLIRPRNPGVCPNTQNVVVGSGTEVIPCWYILLDTYIAGYAADTPFPEIWYSDEYTEYRRRMAEETVSEACPGCIGIYSPNLWEERRFGSDP
ncbi:MAG: radical SAM protein [Planctomycetota bacterium]|jgi:MoaA/NifB/PqqE/SkfB family radical SAM enzyme